MSLVEWAPNAPIPPQSGSTAPIVREPTAAMGGARKYTGEVATGYDAKRVQSAKWVVEQRIIEDMLSDLPRGTRVLDIPVGTGRFLECYARHGFNVVGADISADMIDVASTKITAGQSIQFGIGDITNLNSVPDKTFDVAVAVRVTRWLGDEGTVRALKELQRVAKNRIVFTARTANHPHARSYELIRSALDGWKIARDEAGNEEHYRIIMLEPA